MPSLLTQGNQQLRLGNYAKAIDLYRRVLPIQPDLSSFIKFNLDFALRKLRRNNSDDQSFSSESSSNLIRNWVEHETLQKDFTRPRITLGGMALGYYEEDTKGMLQRVIDCGYLFQQIAQIKDLHGLRLINGEDLIKPLYTKLNPSAFIHEFSDKSIQLRSIWYSNSRVLRLTVEKELAFDSALILRAYQHEPVVGGGLVLVGEYILHGRSWQLTDLSLVNPYLPVLLTLAAPEGKLLDAALIPYPSLFSGGIHEHECYLGFDANQPKMFANELLQEHLRALEHDWALGQVKVDIREAIGSEIILSTDFKEWLWSIFSLQIQPWRPSEYSEASEAYWREVFSAPPLVRNNKTHSGQIIGAREKRTLLCPPKAIPSLRALTACLASDELEKICGTSEFILVQEQSSTHRWRVSWPEMAVNSEWALALDGAIHIPMILLGNKDIAAQNSQKSIGVSAILKEETLDSNSLQLVNPIAPDFTSTISNSTPSYLVDVIITATDMVENVFVALLESLAAQNHIKFRQIIVVLPPSGRKEFFDIHLRSNFVGRYLLLSTPGVDQYKQRVELATAAIRLPPGDAYMVFINQPLVLHDPRTLETLARTLATPKTITTSALLISDVQKKSKSEIAIRSGGFFPARSHGKKEIEFRNESVTVALPRTTLPVASHGDALFMIKAKEWKKSGGFVDIKSQDENAVHEYLTKFCINKKLQWLVPHVTVELHDSAKTQHLSQISWKSTSSLTACKSSVCIEVLPS